MKKTKTIMLIAVVALIAVIFANAAANVFFPEKPDEAPLFTVTVENLSGIDITGFGVTYTLANGSVTTEYSGYAGRKIKNGEVYEIPFYESVFGSSDPSGFVFSFDVNTSGDNFFSALEDYPLSAEKGKTYAFVLEKTPEGFVLSQK